MPFIDLLQSPDGLTVVSAGADETIRFWKIFGPPKIEKESRSGSLDSLLSLKESPIRWSLSFPAPISQQSIFRKEGEDEQSSYDLIIVSELV